ncbi:hypothetical protein TGRH88_071760 [Toxoplasma gondii]|uniref:Uncharacterized protein n=1 Tax=Toxoplasma gondii TaxID=5811 RepID=A0A7J6K4F1_TOXGO|nr:hypothetical protein TGRH88_071760 [Toxoplasma gondii]
MRASLAFETAKNGIGQLARLQSCGTNIQGQIYSNNGSHTEDLRSIRSAYVQQVESFKARRHENLRALRQQKSHKSVRMAFYQWNAEFLTPNAFEIVYPFIPGRAERPDVDEVEAIFVTVQDNNGRSKSEHRSVRRYRASPSARHSSSHPQEGQSHFVRLLLQHAASKCIPDDYDSESLNYFNAGVYLLPRSVSWIERYCATAAIHDELRCWKKKCLPREDASASEAADGACLSPKSNKDPSKMGFLDRLAILLRATFTYYEILKS